MTAFKTAPALLCLLALAACDSADRTVGIEATGTVFGTVFLDRNGDRELDPAVDAPVPGAKVTLLVRGGRTVAAQATADPSGGYVMRSVPVGSYQLVLDSVTLGDSLRVLRVTPEEINVALGDTLRVSVATGRPVVTVAEARRAAAGKRVSIEGVALHAGGLFGDTLLHVADSSGVMRVVRVRAPVAEGDSVRLLGVVGARAGRPVLLTPEAVVIGRGEPPAAVALSTAAAAAAAAGRLDGALVRIRGATIVDGSVSPTGNTRLRVDDGSGTLEVVLDRRAQVTSELPVLPGARVDVAGVLIPGREGAWALHPRATGDLEVAVPPVSVATLRDLPVGQLVAVEATALNAWATFGDATLHLSDGTAAVRAVGVPSSFIFPGDRVRVYGVTAIANGWPALQALAGGTPAILSRAGPPAPAAASTGAATRGGDGGRLDAALVRVSRAVVKDTASLQGGDFLLEVDDGTGTLGVVLESEAGVSSVVFPPDAVLDITGLLVPLPGGRRWVLRPRTRADLVRR